MFRILFFDPGPKIIDTSLNYKKITNFDGMRQESFMLGHEFNWLSWSGLRHYPDDVLTKSFHIFIEFPYLNMEITSSGSVGLFLSGINYPAIDVNIDMYLLVFDLNPMTISASSSLPKYASKSSTKISKVLLSPLAIYCLIKKIFTNWIPYFLFPYYGSKLFML